MFGIPGGGGAAAPLMTSKSTGGETLSPELTALLAQKHTCVLYLMAHGMVTDTPGKQLRHHSPDYKSTIDFYSIIGDGFEKGYSALIPGTFAAGKPVTNYALYASKLYDAFFKSRKDINDQTTPESRDRVLKRIVDSAGSEIVELNKRCNKIKYETGPTWNRNPPETREYSLQRISCEKFREYSEGGLKKREAAKDTIYFPVLGLFIVWTSNPAHKDCSLVRDGTNPPLVDENTPFRTQDLQSYNIFEPSKYMDIISGRKITTNHIYERILDINSAPDNGVYGARQILRRVCNGNPFTLQELSVLFQGFGYDSCIVINASCQVLQASIIPPYNPYTDLIGGQQEVAPVDPFAYGGGPAPLLGQSFASGGVAADSMNDQVEVVEVPWDEYKPSEEFVPPAYRSIRADQSAMRSRRGIEKSSPTENDMPEGGGGTRKNKQKRYRKTQKRKYTRQRHMRRKKQTRRQRR